LGQVTEPRPVKFISACFSSCAGLIDEARLRMEELFGPVDETSETFSFDQTAYYERQMGGGLLKVLWSFQNLVDPGALVRAKLASNDIEREFAGADRAHVPRPVNIDPGYVTPSKLVLATTKDYSHRIYLGRGIYAEVTLEYTSGAFRPFSWTYPDYRTEGCRQFFERVRKKLLGQLRSLSDGGATQ